MPTGKLRELDNQIVIIHLPNQARAADLLQQIYSPCERPIKVDLAPHTIFLGDTTGNLTWSVPIKPSGKPDDYVLPHSPLTGKDTIQITVTALHTAAIVDLPDSGALLCLVVNLLYPDSE